MKQIILALTVVVLVGLAATAVAQTMVVTLTDGRQLVGTVSRTGDSYEIVTATGTIVVPVSQVKSAVERLTPEEEFQKRFAVLAAGDAEGHYGLAMWALEQKLLTQARMELQTVLRLKPDHQNAKLQLQLLEAQLAATPATQEGRPNGELKPADLMNDRDIYRIRLEELRSSDRVSVDFLNQALDRFIERMQGYGEFSRADFEDEFRRRSRVEQTLYMYRYAANDESLKADIQVKGDPQVMAVFKGRIWPIIEQNCATALCHGGVQGKGGLKLFTQATKNDALYYTNFYILDSFEKGDRRMISRDRVPLSLLLQFGLPPELAQYRHPEPIRPMFRDARDPQYVLVRQWIQSLLHPHPPYNLQYKVPGRPDRPDVPAFPPVEPTTAPAAVGGA